MIQMPSHQRPQRPVWRQGLAPQPGGGKAEPTTRFGRTFKLQDEQEPVNQDQALVPQRCRIKPRPVWEAR